MSKEEIENDAVDSFYGSGVARVIENVWQNIRSRHPDVPPVFVITGTGMGNGGMKLGHMCDAQWHHDSTGRVYGELFVAGELLNDGPRLIMQTLLHEAAHSLATVRGIQDCSDEGRYHNREFVRLAVELGLSECVERNGKHGYNRCLITDETLETYAETLSTLEAAELPYLVLPGETPGTALPGAIQGSEDAEEIPETTPVRRQGSRAPVLCQCEPPRRISVTYAQIEIGQIICGNCREQFKPEKKN